MSSRFDNRPRVYDDIEEAVNYYLPINIDLAEKFLNSIAIAKVKSQIRQKDLKLNTPILLERFY